MCSCQGAEIKKIRFPVVMAKGFHLFPYRTQKLSPSAPKVLGWKRPGRIGRRRIPIKSISEEMLLLYETRDGRQNVFLTNSSVSVQLILIQFPVAIAKGFHLFPYRTQKLSPSAPKVLGWKRPGRIGRRWIPLKSISEEMLFLFMHCPDIPVAVRFR